MRIRPLISFALSTILLVGVADANADVPKVDLSTKPAEPSFPFSIYDDNFSGFGAFSSITGAKLGGFTLNVECSSVSDTKCAQANNLRVSVIVPPCPANYDATDVCIKSLRTADSSGVMQSATLQFEADTNKFSKNTEYQLPAGGGASVWRGANAKGGTLDYAVVVDLQINWYRKVEWAAKNTHKLVVGYSAQVIPVKIKSGNYYPIYWSNTQPNGFIYPEPQLPAGVAGADKDWKDCIIVDAGRCAYADKFHADQKIELSLQMDNAVTGWMFGRMKDTKVSATPLAKNTTLLTVEGSSINVPFGQAWVPLKEVATGSPALQEFARFQKIVGNDVTSDRFGFMEPSNHPDLFGFPTSGLLGGEIFKPSPAVAGTGFFSAVEPWLKMTSSAPTWRFQGMSPGSVWGMDQSAANKVWECTVDDNTKLHGLMTTNAMAYSWSPPALKDGFLSYKVAGAHLDSDGSVYKGTYNLSMNADSAKCIYGFTDAPIQATVSITKASGETTNIATELVSVQNGWMNLSANNFTFSDPTIKIKLTQEKAAVKPAPTPSASGGASTTPNKVAVGKVNITCQKGKVVKIVSGSKPVCPTGYKKK
jgi:hypothetical protein